MWQHVNKALYTVLPEDCRQALVVALVATLCWLVSLWPDAWVTNINSFLRKVRGCSVPQQHTLA
jgi:hypothetical protein